MSDHNKKFYQVYQCHAPSGGVSAVDQTRYDTVEEARGVAESLMSGVSEFTLCNIGGKEYAYPAYWAQALREHKGVITIELS